MNVGSGNTRFGDFELDLPSGKLLRDGHPVKIQPQPLRVLAILVERAGEIVSREELRGRIWGEATFVEFDQGLNYCIRQIRLALNDDANAPDYIETLPKLGYRFIASVSAEAPAEQTVPAEPGLAAPDLATDPSLSSSPIAQPPPPRVRRFSLARNAAMTLSAIALAAVAVGAWLRSEGGRGTARQPAFEMKQITDFADSAVAPAISPDGRMVAFFRGGRDFFSADQIYVKMLPDGEPKRLTDDPRPKYGPVFSSDGSEVAYTAVTPGFFSTYAVPVLGGESRLLLSNAAGLTWLDRDRLLFSQIKSGVHMGIVTATESRANLRELYFPPFERAMAHYSFASPDRASALVVEMNEKGGFGPCKIISLEAKFEPRTIGPQGACTSAGWSRDGRWMYFAANVDGKSHLWRQAFPQGSPEQITFGPAEERGIAMDPDGHSLITSAGVHESTLWMHEKSADRPLSSEGEVVAWEGFISIPSFSPDGQLLYYLIRNGLQGSGQELRRMTMKTGVAESLFPGVSIQEYDVSPDGRQVLYTTMLPGGKTQLWLAPTDRGSEPKRIGINGETEPHFGPSGEIIFRLTEGASNYLMRMNPDGSGRAKLVPYPVSGIETISPQRNWLMAEAPLPGSGKIAPVAIPARGGPPVRMCETYCLMSWSADGKFVMVSVEDTSSTKPGRSLALPTGLGESLPLLPKDGIPAFAKPDLIRGARSVPSGDLVAGVDPDTFVYIKVGVHSNLFRLTLP